MTVTAIQSYWGNPGTWGKSYAGARVVITLPCGHPLQLEVAPSCTYLTDARNPAQQRFHTASDIHKAMDNGCQICGAVYRPLPAIVDHVHGIILRFAVADSKRELEHAEDGRVRTEDGRNAPVDLPGNLV